MTDLSIHAFSDADLDAVVEVLKWSLGADRTGARAWMQRAPQDGLVVARQRGVVVGCALTISTTQSFGGAMLPTAAIAAVGVLPEARGAGVGHALITQLCDAARAAGTPLATLYPSTRAFYRRFGFEVAGARSTYRAPLDAFASLAAARHSEACLEIRPLDTTPDAPGRDALDAVYARAARCTQGHLGRAPYFWNRIFGHDDAAKRAYAFDGPRGTEGYAILDLVRPDPGAAQLDIHVLDHVADTSRAQSALARLIMRHRGMGQHVQWRGGPSDPLAFALDTPWTASTNPMGAWMLNVLRPADALAARTWPQRGQLALHIAGHAWHMEVNPSGRAHITAGPSDAPALHMDACAFAALFSGHLSPARLARLGRLRGSTDALAFATALFATDAPWMPDAF